MLPANVALGADIAPFEFMVQADRVDALALRAAEFRALTAERPAILRMALLYSQAFAVQVAHSAVSNAHHSLTQRLARWLLMVHDRIGRDDLPMTHEFVSMMLAVRRTTVTETLHVL